MSRRKYDPICSYPDCGRKHNAKGLCGPHGAMQRRGEPLRPIQNRTGPLRKPDIERFLDKVIEHPSGCLLWEGGKTLGGYGMFSTELSHRSQVKVMAHRWAYEYYVGPIPEGLDIDHLCKTRACVNTDHLEPVTRAENIRRAFEDVTHCPQGHLYDEENTYVRPGTTHRKCRACARKRDLERRDEKNARRRAIRAMWPKKPRVLKAFCKRGHPLSGDNLYVPPSGRGRQCRECRRLHDSKSRKEKAV